MYTQRKNDSVIMEAVKASTGNHHARAAALFQEAGNQYRNPQEKRALWDAAEKARRLHNSD